MGESVFEIYLCMNLGLWIGDPHHLWKKTNGLSFTFVCLIHDLHCFQFVVSESQCEVVDLLFLLSVF